MPVLPLLFGTDPALKKKASPVEELNDEIKQIIQDMFETLYEYRGIGMAANMVDIQKEIIVIDLQEDGSRKPSVFINPKITWASKEQEAHEEASLCFPGISAEIKRPSSIKLQFLNENGEAVEQEAEGWLATVIQHEMDYLSGKTYLDHISKMKKDRLIKKMVKQQKSQAQHSCGDPHCTDHHH